MSQSDFVTRGQALVSAGQYQEAVKVCRLGLLGRPTTVEGRVVLGQALLALKRYDEVLAEMRVALELDHTSLPSQVLKGEALLRKGDPHGAIEVLQRARIVAPTDPKITGLLAEAQRSMGRPAVTASHPAVGFIGGTESTKHYPNHGGDADEEDTGDDGTEDSGGSFTRPTSLAAPQAKKRSTPPRPAAAEATPPPNVLAVGDRSGTVEVDPDLDGVEVDGDDDFGDVAAPPLTRKKPGAPIDPGPRGQVIASKSAPSRGKPLPSSSARGQLPPPSRGKPRQKVDISTVELDDDEMVELDETLPPDARRAGPGPGTAVRNAVKMPSGPIDQQLDPPEQQRMPLPSPAANRPTQHQPVMAPPPHLAQLLASAQQMAPPPQPLPPPPRGNPIAAALPTMAAQPMPPQPGGFSQTLGFPPGNPAAVRPTVALNAAQQQSANAVDALFGQQQQPVWGREPMPLPPNDPASGRPQDPHMANMFAVESNSAAVSISEPISQSGSRPLKTGMRRGRTRFQIILWFFIGALVIGGGVFAGFQIRAMRLRKQIGERRDEAVALAQADTWKGWIGARDRLVGIAQASSTPDNRAALARTRALVAFEFGEGIADARAAVEGLAGQAGLDADLAAAYLALAESDAKAAKTAADRATAAFPNDAAAQYVTGQAALLAGDTAEAIKNLKAAFERDARPIYGVGLAHAYADASLWKDSLATLDKASAAWQTAIGNDKTSSPDFPAAVIERGMVLSASGYITPGGPVGNEIRAKLQKVISEGLKQLTEQAGGVSPAQVAFADLALAQVDFARNDRTAANADFRAALTVNYDEQRFAEQAIDTLYALNELGGARAAAEGALAGWPTSRRARIGMARILLAQGKSADALDIVNKTPNIKDLPRALAVRGTIQLALGNLDAARADLDDALKRSKSLELALVGRLWLHLAQGEVDEAKTRIEKLDAKLDPATASVALATVYAAILRQDPATRDKARSLLERVVAGPPGIDIPRAQLELARIYRDTGDIRSARTAYAEASRTGNQDARLEGALLQIEDRDLLGGRDTLDQLIKGAGDKPGPALLLEAARARMLVGEHKGAEALLDQADKILTVTRWMLDRERGRLALRKGDYTGAATALARALESCGDDAETFLLAAEVAAADEKQARLGERIKVVAVKQLKARPEAQIVAGKLLLSKGDEALKAFEAARVALEAEKASPRRLAQAQLGRAIVAYNRQDDIMALDALESAIAFDPSLYAAYLYLADITKDKDPKKALAFAEKSVQYNPDLVEGHVMVGTLAAKLKNKKLLAESITKVGDLAPNSEYLRQLQSLR